MKKFARIFASSLLKTTLFAAAITAGVIATLSSPSNLKQSLNDSGLYDGLVANILKEADADAATDATKQNLDLNQPQIKQAAEAALPPETLRDTTEQVIDGVFRWLDGEVAAPDFRVDLTEAKQAFIRAAGQEAETYVAGLPVCTAQDLGAIDPQADAFSLTCRPPMISAAAARQNVEADLASNEDFLKDPVLTADTLSKNEDGETAFQQASEVPKAYQRAKSATWILLGVSLILGAVVFFLSDSRRKGTKSLAMTLVGAGLFVLLTTWLASFVFDRLARPEGAIGKAVDGSLQSSLLAVARSLNELFSERVLVYGLSYLVLGGLALLALKFFWKQPETTPASLVK